MEKKQEWFNDSSFWEIYAPIMFDQAHWEEVPDVADSVTRLANLNLYGESPLSSTPKVLDLCCGFGRISAELARRGFAVTGVDITESYLKTAREEAALEKLDIEYINQDAREFLRSGYFDTALSMYISFGYFENPDDDKKLVKNVFDSLKPGGSFIIETLGKEIQVRDFVEAEWFTRAGYTVLTEYEAVDSWTYLKNRWILIDDKSGNRIERSFTQRLYSASELRSLLQTAGFEKVEIYGDWDESLYDRDAEKLIVIGRKK